MSPSPPPPLDATKLVGLLADDDRRRVVAALILGAVDVGSVQSLSGLGAASAGKALARLQDTGLVERSKDRELVLVDGVKVIHDDGWALVLPDPDEPVTHVWAEGPSDAEAVRLAQEYARRIRQILR